MYEYVIAQTKVCGNYEITNNDGEIIGYEDTYDDAVNFIVNNAFQEGIIYYEIYLI